MSSDMNNPFYYAQNILEGFDSDVEELPPILASPPPTSAYSPPPETTGKNKITSRSSKKRNLSDNEGLSYVMSKKSRKGLRLIKIEIFDLTDHTNSKEPALKAQHVVLDPIDEILDMSESVVRKISKTLCERY